MCDLREWKQTSKMQLQHESPLLRLHACKLAEYCIIGDLIGWEWTLVVQRFQHLQLVISVRRSFEYGQILFLSVVSTKYIIVSPRLSDHCIEFGGKLEPLFAYYGSVQYAL